MIYQNKKKLLFILLGLLLLASWFYWHELKPAQVRRNCEWLIFSKESVAYTGSRAVRQNNEFRHCLVKNGLKPESLFVNTQ